MGKRAQKVHAAGNSQMNRIIRTAGEPGDPEESPEDESPAHEWAEYHPLAMLMGLAAEEDDRLAFIGLGLENDPDLPEGSA